MFRSEELRRSLYYFFYLPLWSLGIKNRIIENRILKILKTEVHLLREGTRQLLSYKNPQKGPEESEVEEIVYKSLMVKITRDSDAYSCLGMKKRRMKRYFRIEGIENLEECFNRGRPLIILTGHYGSFFIPPIFFWYLGYPVYPVARSVDRSPATPLSTRIYLTLNYKFAERRFPARYIYTNFSGFIDRTVIEVMRNKKILWTAIDIPERLYPYKRIPVKLFGRPSSLPAGIVQWGIKKRALFTTAWCRINISGGSTVRVITIDKEIDNDHPEEVLQIYADRLTDRVFNEPWQWMGLPIVSQYEERQE